VLSVLIGGLITLVVTLLVQILVVPCVQRRTRKRERWERDITELQTLLEVEFPRNVRALRRAVVSYFAFHELPAATLADAVTRPVYAAAEADAVAAHDSLSDSAMRALWLGRRAAIYKPGRDPYWSRLLTSMGELNGNMMALAPRGVTKGRMTAKEYDGVLDEAHRLSGLLLATLALTADPLEPPKSRSVRRALGWVPERLGLTRRARPAKATPSGEQAPRPS